VVGAKVDVEGAETKPAPITPLLVFGLKYDVTAAHRSGSLVKVGDADTGRLPVVSTRLRGTGVLGEALHAMLEAAKGPSPVAPLK
jgi:hypothetical protein